VNFYDHNPDSSKPLVHLAHANGFPPSTYRLALQSLYDHFHIVSLYARPFWPDCPPASTLKDWSVFSKDLIQGIEQFAKKPIIAIGHSLGGVATLQAAVERPDLFSKVVLMDPTMLPPSLLRKVWWMKLFGWEGRKELVEGALRRRRHWDSQEQAFGSFKGKSLFKKWPEQTFKAYVEGMTRENRSGGVDLAYSADWEAQIYRTIPTDVWKWVPKLQPQTLVLRGETSNTFMAESEEAFRKLRPQTTFSSVPGAGHLVAQEAPHEVGQILLKFLQTSR
jgi:pimeloyl-ACP methyl ester carboxylesterase